MTEKNIDKEKIAELEQEIARLKANENSAPTPDEEKILAQALNEPKRSKVIVIVAAAALLAALLMFLIFTLLAKGFNSFSDSISKPLGTMISDEKVEKTSQNKSSTKSDLQKEHMPKAPGL